MYTIIRISFNGISRDIMCNAAEKIMLSTLCDNFNIPCEVINWEDYDPFED